MSGPSAATYTTASGGDVSIVINGCSKIAGWQTVEINRSVELIPNHFMLTMTEEFSNDPTRRIVNPGDHCQVFIGPDLVITGYIDRYEGAIGANRHDVRIIGRGLCEDIVDCSADIIDTPMRGGAATATGAVDLAVQLCQNSKFAITVTCPFLDLAGPILTFQVQLGETPYEIIERVARYQGYLVFEDEKGQLVLDRVPPATQAMASGFAQGVNVEQASLSSGYDERFSEITVLWSTTDGLSEGAKVSPTIRRSHGVVDNGLQALGRFRPRLVPSTQSDNSPTFGQRMAEWEMTRRIGRSQAVHITCDSWRDQKGKLWTPNWFAVVTLPALKLVNNNWVIVSVVFRKDQNGTHADLVLMPPGALSLEPSTLLPFDSEVTNTVPSSQNPPPASTSGPAGLLGHV
jgi:prophage tail gpP-like protein